MQPNDAAGWDPGQYLKFADHRLRPAADLLARVPRADCASVWDLGCGAGNVTRLLAARWPRARIAGLDSSPAMLDQARTIPGIAWVAGDIATWHAAEPADLVFSNAALHWVRDHRTLMPRLMAALASGGVLAVQMPRNAGMDSHRLLAQVVHDGPWAGRLAPVLALQHVDAPADYLEWLGPVARDLDIWETEYLHVLRGRDPVVDWVRGSALKPLLDALAPDEAATFLKHYTARVASAYPARADGTTLFPFRRLFVVAVR